MYAFHGKIIKDTQVSELKEKPTRECGKIHLGKTFASRLRLRTNKISVIHLGNDSNTNVKYEIEHTLREMQNTFTSQRKES